MDVFQRTYTQQSLMKDGIDGLAKRIELIGERTYLVEHREVGRGI